MKFLAVSIAAIFLSVSARTAETTNSPVSSQFAAAAKAAKVSSKVKKTPLGSRNASELCDPAVSLEEPPAGSPGRERPCDQRSRLKM